MDKVMVGFNENEVRQLAEFIAELMRLEMECSVTNTLNGFWRTVTVTK